MKKVYSIFILCGMLLTGCTSKVSSQVESTVSTTSTSIQTKSTLDTGSIFTSSDLEQSVDISKSTSLQLESNQEVTIDQAGSYILNGDYENLTVYVKVDDSSKIDIILDNLNVVNQAKPVFVIESGDKINFVLAENTTNTLKVTEFQSEYDTVIDSKSDLVFKGTGTLKIDSTYNGISSNDDLKITGGNYEFNVEHTALKSHDLFAYQSATTSIKAGQDGIHVEDNDDTSVGVVYISSGNITIDSGDDAIHATTILQVDDGNIQVNQSVEGLEATQIYLNGGTINICASDDGINASNKSDQFEPCIVVNGGEIKVTMGQGDTDGFDANGSIYVNGGTIEVNGQSAFDYDVEGVLSGGTVIVNGTQVTTLENQQFANHQRFGSPKQGQTPPDMTTQPTKKTN